MAVHSVMRCVADVCWCKGLTLSSDSERKEMEVIVAFLKTWVTGINWNHAACLED